MNTEIKNGIKAFYILGVYFLAVELFGLAHTGFLRIFNILIVGYYVNRSILSGMKEGRGFVALFGSAFFTNLVAVILSTVALFIYVGMFRGAEHIETLAQPLLAIGGFKLSVSQFTFAIFAEGFASGVILSYGMMQYWKNRIKNVSRQKI